MLGTVVVKILNKVFLEQREKPTLKMLEACRTCLRLIDEDHSVFYKIEAEDAKLSKESCRYKLLSLVPDMVLNITSKLCSECYGSLEALFKFKEKCLKTENIITQYLKAKPDVDMNNLDLKDVYTFNMGNSSVKEEVKTFEDFAAVDETITVVKHEIDDYLSETVEVVRPENTVLNSKEKSRKDRFGCHICDKRYGKKHELTLHLRKHNGERLHVCAVCGLSYFTSQRLRVHERIHTGERPYQCKECPMNFRSHNLLNQHRKIHAGIRNFKCEHCDKSFIKKWGLQKHLRLHTGEKPFCCDICDRRFVQKHHLTSHLRRHTGEEPYQCETCGMGFAVHGALTKHRQRVFPCESRKTSKKKKESKICSMLFT